MDDVIKANSSIISDKILSYRPYPNATNNDDNNNANTNTDTHNDDGPDPLITLWLGMFEPSLQEANNDNENLFREYVR